MGSVAAGGSNRRGNRDVRRREHDVPSRDLGPRQRPARERETKAVNGKNLG